MSTTQSNLVDDSAPINPGDPDYEDFLGDEEEPSPAFTPAPLPILTNEPHRHPDSCLTLSLPLIKALHAQLPPAPDLTLSIGSGTGLVEALLDSLAGTQDQNLSQAPYALQASGSSSQASPAPRAALNLTSIEIAPSPNTYHRSHRTVPGTWALDLAAAEAKAWVFVYPKQVALVRKYMEAFASNESGGNGAVETVVYVGPRMDWDDFRGALEPFAESVEVWDEERMEGVGGQRWECAVRVTVKK
ncbi:hypothetical protein COL5a_002882 [Colletotrichum fioriniae]|uniref:uncharacterized protein n=1 Tax=Colletotrichum fioriniae TaxID=710243 RepID=UPI002300B6C5|nr:uncharacterized protein COL516b_009990 [Colletotrichum fioriniae]KAJ0298337.1 hypothetical protein COL516b_009990 [Colletotrichum fioriniae]KAJ0331341.1 hypothetical protein COL5a_002882 [Colletotrichum fioriniae]KAJ3950065.1 hypothetical protein N0V96_001201 [Colletotrichum fioriniae]